MKANGESPALQWLEVGLGAVLIGSACSRLFGTPVVDLTIFPGWLAIALSAMVAWQVVRSRDSVYARVGWALLMVTILAGGVAHYAETFRLGVWADVLRCGAGIALLASRWDRVPREMRATAMVVGLVAALPAFPPARVGNAAAIVSIARLALFAGAGLYAVWQYERYYPATQPEPGDGNEDA